MFCPKCGQQASDEVRFCPRCGLSLAGLPAYVAGNDFAAARPAAAPPPNPEQTAKRLATRRAAKMMFFSVVLFPVFFGLCFLVDGPVPLFVPLTLFLAGFVMLVYARLFGDELINVGRRTSPEELAPGGSRPALGASQFVPAPHFNQQRANTAEIYQPPSITENTTKLLDKDT
ncbi:MAG TPA: zinc ribbon domain-containing protein [Pyrinomonadaceae bacterium]